MTTDKSQPPPIEVHIRVSDDADAVRISGVLEALGFRVVRELEASAGDARLRWAIDRLTRQHRLTGREAEVLAGVLDGYDNTGLAAHLQISRATVKWHMHNLFCKCGVGNREALLREALQLQRPQSSSTPGDPAPPDDGAKGA